MTTAELIERLRTDDSTHLEEWDLRQASAARLAEQEAENKAMRGLLSDASQRLIYSADTFHNQGCMSRHDACRDLADRIDAALATDQKGGET